MSTLNGMNRGENVSHKYIPGMIHCKLITFGPGGQQFIEHFPPVDPRDLKPPEPNFDKISKSSLLNYAKKYGIDIPTDFTPRQIREEVKHHFRTVLSHLPVSEKDVIGRLTEKIDNDRKNHNPHEHLQFLYDYD